MEPVFINITNLRLSYKETWSFPDITNFMLSLIVKADRLLWTELKATRACIPRPMSLYPETYEPVSRDIWACILRSMSLYPETYEPVSRDLWACIPRSMSLYPEIYEPVSRDLWGLKLSWKCPSIKPVLLTPSWPGSKFGRSLKLQRNLRISAQMVRLQCWPNWKLQRNMRISAQMIRHQMLTKLEASRNAVSVVRNK